MTKLTDVQKNYIENRKGLILKLRDELNESYRIMADEWDKVHSIHLDVMYVFDDYYKWLEEEGLTATPPYLNCLEIVESRKALMKSWRNLGWNCGDEVLQLLKSAQHQLMQRLDAIANALNDNGYEY